MNEHTGFSLPTDIVDSAIAHAEKEYGIFLYRELLIELYKELLDRRRILGFNAALTAVLDERYAQRDAHEQALYKGIKSALGVIASGLKARREKPKEPRTRTPLDRLKDHVITDSDNPQSRFAF